MKDEIMQMKWVINMNININANHGVPVGGKVMMKL